MVKRASKTSKRRLNVYSNLSHQRKTKKDAAARKRAEYLASLPKHPLKRFFYRLHPRRVAAFWFSKRGLFAALKVVGVTVLLAVLMVGGLFAYYRKDLDQIRPAQLAKRVQTTVTKYYDRNDKLLWEDKGDGNYKLVVEGDEISDYLKKATVAIEDRDFYSHGGISISGLTRAVLNNASNEGGVQGGSTLTQQLVKQVFFADEAQKRGLDGVPRKIKEMILAIEVERMYDKDRILELYLNESPYGGRRNGAESAAQTYFDKPAKKLDLAESALLAAIPNQPGLYDPYNNAGHEALIARQHKVLDSMVEVGYITKAEADAAKKVSIIDKIKPETDQYKNIKAPHFVQMVRSELEEQLGKAVVGKGGLIVKTTLDVRIQKKLEAEMKAMFKSHYPNMVGFTNGAAMVEDVRTGQVVAMMGSRDFRYPGYGQDNAAVGFIQPGSSIKPLVYAKLFENKGAGKQNFGSGSVLSDVRTTFEGGWTPRNASGRFSGNLTIRQSLARSLNIPAAKAMAINGVAPTLESIRQMGGTYYCTQGTEKQAGLAASIGGCGTRMVDHVNAIASLGRLGVYKPQTSILEVKDSDGQIVSKYKDEQKRIINQQAAYIVADILADRNAGLGLYGRSITPSLDAAGIRAAIKTGTSDIDTQPKDLWSVGFTPSIAATVWLGNSDPRALYQEGSYIPAIVMDNVMVEATKIYVKDKKAKEGEWFSQPAGIQRIGNELFPSYYNRNAGISNAKMTFDRVSKKKATKCTPDAARIEVGVRKTKDPFSKKDVFLAPDGYDATREDDVHKCGDVKPSINGIVAGNGRITVSVSKGTFSLDKLIVRVNGEAVSTKNISGSGTYPFQYNFTRKRSTITVEVVDTGMYSGSASETHVRGGGGSGDDD